MVLRYGQAALLEGHFLAGEKPGLALSVSRLLGLATELAPDNILVVADLLLCFADSANSTLQFIALQLSPQQLVLFS